MFSNKLKKGSVALATTALVTSIMVGSAFANTYSCAPAGAPSWSSKVIAKTTTEHNNGDSEAICASADVKVTIKSSDKFNGEFSKQMYAEARKDGHEYAISENFQAGETIVWINRNEPKGKYCALYSVFGNPVVGEAYDKDGRRLDQQMISWIGKTASACRKISYVKK